MCTLEVFSLRHSRDLEPLAPNDNSNECEQHDHPGPGLGPGSGPDLRASTTALRIAGSIRGEPQPYSHNVADIPPRIRSSQRKVLSRPNRRERIAREARLIRQPLERKREPSAVIETALEQERFIDRSLVVAHYDL